MEIGAGPDGRADSGSGHLDGGACAVTGQSFSSYLIFLPVFFLAVPAGVALAETPAINDFNLIHSYTCGDRTFLLQHEGVEPDATIKLTQSGQPDILATDMDRSDWHFNPPGRVWGVFDLGPGTAGGLWSLVVTNPGGESATLPDVLEVDPTCPRGRVGDLYVCNGRMDNILQFDGMTGDFVCVFAETPPDFPGQKPQPTDLAWAPDGNLWVIFDGWGSPDPHGIVKYDGQTGEFLGYTVTCEEDLPPPITLSFGGPVGNAYVATVPSEIYEVDWVAGGVLGFVFCAEPPMINAVTGRFASNGNYLLLGGSFLTPVPTFREYDGQTFELVRDIAVDLGYKNGVIETPDGASYLVSEDGLSSGGRVDQYDVTTADFLGTVIPRSPCLDQCPDCPDPDPCFFEAMECPTDIAFGPNGHLYVSAEGTYVPDFPPFDYFSMGAIHEFDLETAEQVRVIGRQGYFDCAGCVEPQKLWEPHGIEFKPLPGDYTSSAGAFMGNWQVDLADFEKFQSGVTEPGSLSTDPHRLLSFDSDRDGDIDLADFAAFQRWFGSSIGD